VYLSGPEIIFPNFDNFSIHNLASYALKTNHYLLRGRERLTPAGLGKGMVDWLSKVRLVSFRLFFFATLMKY